MRIGYIRVSTMEQNEDRQFEGLAKYKIEKWFTEKVSGKNMDREQLQAMLDFVRSGDTIYVHDFSRLARSTKDLLDIVEILKKKDVGLVSNKEAIDTATPQGKLMLTMIAAIYEFERSNLLERQAEGIRIKKALDKTLPLSQRTYKGRKAITISDKDWERTYARYLNREITKADMARILKISRPTLYKIMKEKTGN